MRGAPIKAVQELLGHADIKMTMIYAHLGVGMKRTVVALLDQPAPFDEDGDWMDEVKNDDGDDVVALPKRRGKKWQKTRNGHFLAQMHQSPSNGMSLKGLWIFQ